MADKGHALNQKVWKLFAKAGFKTKPNETDKEEEKIKLDEKKYRTVDLLAWDDELKVKIIGWNKARKGFTESFSVHMHDYQKLQSNAKADSVLFVLTEKEPDEADFEYARRNGMRVWGKEELEYYQILVDTIGDYAKYEIINSFGIKTKEEKLIRYSYALKFEQPFTDAGRELFLFSITPDFLLKTCVVLRKAQGSKDAYQRILNKKRLEPIRKFITQPNALLPTNIVVHLSDEVTYDVIEQPVRTVKGEKFIIAKPDDCKLVVLKIPTQYASLELIDGQHRLFGFVHSDPATKKYFNLAVLGIAKIEANLRTKTFVAINDKAKKVDTKSCFVFKVQSR